MTEDRQIRQIVLTPSRLVKEVRIYEQSWSAKVAIDHSDVPYDLVIQTIEDPCVICESKTQPSSLVLINELRPNLGGAVLRVPVKVYPDGTGTFKSAYYSGAASHGAVVWRRGDG